MPGGCRAKRVWGRLSEDTVELSKTLLANFARVGCQKRQFFLIENVGVDEAWSVERFIPFGSGAIVRYASKDLCRKIDLTVVEVRRHLSEMRKKCGEVVSQTHHFRLLSTLWRS